MIFNWQRKCIWSDSKNARFIQLIDGRGNLYLEDLDRSRLHVGCKIDELVDRLNLFKTFAFKYPLQKWRGVSYKLFEYYSMVEIPEKESLMLEVHTMLKKTAASAKGELEVKVVTAYLRKHFEPAKITKRLCNAIRTSQIYERLYAAAHSFVKTNRSHELKLFEKMYLSKHPRDCFINLYDLDLESGIATHRDHVSFCTVVVCLQGNSEGNLVITQETGELLTVSLSSNEMIVFARVEHSVDIVTRSEKRITLNAFF